MQEDKISETKKLLQDALTELETTKGSVASGVRLLKRAAQLLEDNDVAIWCDVQLGETKYTRPLLRLQTAISDESSLFKAGKGLPPAVSTAIADLADLKAIGLDWTLYIEDIAKEASNGFSDIGFIEEKYADFVRTKRNNDGTYYRTNLLNHIMYVKKIAHDKASQLYNNIAFASAPQTVFGLLKEEINDKLLDLDPELAEKLMLAFRSVASDNPEEWSQALTSCRRFVEGLADLLFPASDKVVNGKSLGKSQYINRLWAFMDQSIESDSNKDLAKVHVDLLGNYLQKTHKLNNKGVHAELTKVEAVKTVFHVYLLVADILDYLDQEQATEKKLEINTVSLDELESFLGISRSVAKEIIKLRAERGPLRLEDLANVSGVGAKTMSKARIIFNS